MRNPLYMRSHLRVFSSYYWKYFLKDLELVNFISPGDQNSHELTVHERDYKDAVRILFEASIYETTLVIESRLT